MATKDTVVQELVVNTLTHKQFKAAQEAGTLSPYELYGTPDTSVRLPVLTPMWFDHVTNDVSWLCADTFSWQSGDVYKAAYEHLASELPETAGNILYAWGDSIDNSEITVVCYTRKETPSIGDVLYDANGAETEYKVSTYVENGFRGTNGDIWRRAYRRDELNGAIREDGVTYYQAEDGHKICLPDQEANVSALYESTGVAWYYILDIENKQFKLPRTKYGFVGMRDGVGNYVPESLPNVTASFSNSAFSGASGKANQTSGAAYATNLGNSVYSGSGGGSSNSLATTNIDASLSSSAYQDGAPVQQRATQMYLYFYVGNFEQDAVEQTAGLNAELFNSKLDIELGNANATTKSTIVGWGIPDYSAGVSFTPAVGTTFTAPSDGIALVYLRVTGGNGNLIFNGTTIGLFGGSNANHNNFSLPMNKDDTITVTMNTGAIDNGIGNFYPFKGVN